MSAEVFDEMLDAQDFKCANTGCRTPLDRQDGKKKRPHVDHDHATGLVRGILCHGCNVALGMLGDSSLRLDGLKEYLRSTRKDRAA
jgi:hypothetical protein